MASIFVTRFRFSIVMCVLALFAGVACYGMEGLCVATRNLHVTIPDRELSPGGFQSLLRHMETEAIADMLLRGEVQQEQLSKLPPQDRECVEACAKSHFVWEGFLDMKLLSERETSFVKKYLKKLLIEKVSLSVSDEARKQSIFEEVKTKPEWLRRMFARCFFLRNHGQDIGQQIGLASIGTFKTEKLLKAGILASDWSTCRPEELTCYKYMADFKDRG